MVKMSDSQQGVELKGKSIAFCEPRIKVDQMPEFMISVFALAKLLMVHWKEFTEDALCCR